MVYRGRARRPAVRAPDCLLALLFLLTLIFEPRIFARQLFGALRLKPLDLCICGIHFRLSPRLPLSHCPELLIAWQSGLFLGEHAHRTRSGRVGTRNLRINLRLVLLIDDIDVLVVPGLHRPFQQIARASRAVLSSEEQQRSPALIKNWQAIAGELLHDVANGGNRVAGLTAFCFDSAFGCRNLGQFIFDLLLIAAVQSRFQVAGLIGGERPFAFPTEELIGDLLEAGAIGSLDTPQISNAGRVQIGHIDIEAPHAGLQRAHVVWLNG